MFLALSVCCISNFQDPSAISAFVASSINAARLHARSELLKRLKEDTNAVHSADDVRAIISVCGFEHDLRVSPSCSTKPMREEMLQLCICWHSYGLDIILLMWIVSCVERTRRVSLSHYVGGVLTTAELTRTAFDAQEFTQTVRMRRLAAVVRAMEDSKPFAYSFVVHLHVCRLLLLDSVQERNRCGYDLAFPAVNHSLHLSPIELLLYSCTAGSCCANAPRWYISLASPIFPDIHHLRTWVTQVW